MFRVVGKESPNIYSRIGVKLALKKLNFINLDRYLICRAAVKHWAETTF